MFVLATLFCISLIFVLNIRVAGMDSGAVVSILGNAVNQGHGGADIGPDRIMGYILSGIAITVFFVSVFISLFSVSGVFPDLMKKGSIDLIIAKPVSRTSIFLQRFGGAMSVTTAGIFYTLFFSWTVLSLKFGIWNARFLYSGLIIVFFFFNIFSLLTLLSMILKNGVISLLLSYFAVFILSPIISAVNRYALPADSIYAPAVKFLDFILPEVSDTVMGIADLVSGAGTSLYIFTGPLLTGVIFTAVSVHIFRKTDF